jgi:predicted AAA+ superfamily ATPase
MTRADEIAAYSTMGDQPIPNSPEPTKKPIIIGFYGVSGCGKSFLLRTLSKALGETAYTFFDGSVTICEILEGGIEEFKTLDDAGRTAGRIQAITSI